MEKFEVRQIGVAWEVAVPTWGSVTTFPYVVTFWEFEDAMKYMKKRLKEAKNA